MQSCFQSHFDSYTLKLLSPELLPDFLFKCILENQSKLDKIFKNLIKISKQLSTKLNQKKKKADTENLVNETLRLQEDFIKNVLITKELLLLAKSDFNDTKVIMPFSEISEKERLQRSLEKRKALLKKYAENINEFQKLSEIIKSMNEKVDLYQGFLFEENN